MSNILGAYHYFFGGFFVLNLLDNTLVESFFEKML